MQATNKSRRVNFPKVEIVNLGKAVDKLEQFIGAAIGITISQSASTEDMGLRSINIPRPFCWTTDIDESATS